MEQQIIHDLLRRYGYGAIALVTGLESMGLPLPGETLLVAAALYAVATGRLDISAIVLCAALGAVVGDNAGYAIGRYYGAPLLRRHGGRIGLTPRRLILGQYLFLHYGAAVVFFGRFTALLRAFAALMAGANQMNWGRFLLWNAAGGAAWAALMGYGAYLLGARILKFAAPVGIAIGAATIVAAAVLAWVLHRKGMALEDRAVEEMAALGVPAEPVVAKRPAV